MRRSRAYGRVATMQSEAMRRSRAYGRVATMQSEAMRRSRAYNRAATSAAARCPERTAPSRKPVHSSAVSVPAQ